MSTLRRNETIRDVLGHDIRVGNLVRIRDLETLKAQNPNDKVEEFLERLEHQKAIVQDFAGNKVVIKLLNQKLLGKISSTSVIYDGEGPEQQISDGTNVGVGSYVTVYSNTEALKTLSLGHKGWEDGMLRTSGKVGRVLDIDPDGDVVVGFPWGHIFYFNPEALSPGTADNLETLDCDDNFIKKESAARIVRSKEDFVALQLKNKLPACPESRSLVGKLVSIRRVVITPYSRDSDVVVLNHGKRFVLNTKSIRRVSQASDRNGQPIHIGSSVNLTATPEEMKTLQTEEFGGLPSKLDTILGQNGTVNRFLVNPNVQPSDVIVQVNFEGGIGTYYLNPKALSGQVECRPNLQILKAEATPGEANNQPQSPDVTLTEPMMIERDRLKCSQKKLGGGCFGTVHTGLWKGTKCAIKKIQEHLTDTIPGDKILGEARIHFSLKHPNIVQLFGISIDHDLWLVMQHVEGRNLFEVIFPKLNQPAQKLYQEDKINISIQLTNAISHLHGLSLLHGDIKPHNIILSKSPSIQVYLCDFGMSRFMYDVYSTTFTEKLKGSKYYMGPECFIRDHKGERYLRPTLKADIWSVGCVLYELFQGTELLPNTTIYNAVKYDHNDAAIKGAVQDINTNVRDIIADALKMKPEDRPTASEMNFFFIEAMKFSSN